MALPAGWTEVPITGTYLDLGGNPARGSITFRSRSTVVVEGVVVVPQRTVAVLDGTGSINITLRATDDPLLNPTGWRYHVTEHIYGKGRPSYWLDVPHESLGIDLVNHTPLHAVDGVPVVMGEFVEHVHPNSELSGIEVLTLSEYQALLPDPNTLYFIQQEAP